jgi:plasmid segregation protein ParM
VQVLAVDLGFGFTKATDGEQSVVFKSVIGEADTQQFAGQTLIQRTPEDHLHFEFGDQRLFVGDMAERQSNVRSFTLDQERFIKDASATLTLAALTRLARPGEPIGVVSGLPISEFTEYSGEMERTLRGEHRFVTIDERGEREEVRLDIAEVQVIPQPFGAMYDLLLDDRGEIADRRLMQDKVGIIDVGFQTADFTIADRTNFLERGSLSTDSGIARAFSLIAAKLREKSGVNIEIYRLYEAVEQGRIKIRGDHYDLQKLTDHVMGQLATEIASSANELWADDWDIDSIVISGGGGAVLAPYISPLVQGRVMPVESGRDNRLNNVRGFRKYGAHAWGEQLIDVVAPTAQGASSAEAPADAIDTGIAEEESVGAA